VTSLLTVSTDITLSLRSADLLTSLRFVAQPCGGRRADASSGGPYAAGGGGGRAAQLRRVMVAVSAASGSKGEKPPTRRPRRECGPTAVRSGRRQHPRLERAQALEEI
jgi:hypothetical protein